jgi:hypothetical protein
MRERERKERGEILNEDRDKMDVGDMEEEGKGRKRKEWELGKKC